MTDRLVGCTVIFDKDIRDDDAEIILQAIRSLKRVVQVDPVISTMDSAISEVRGRSAVINELIDYALRLRDKNQLQ